MNEKASKQKLKRPRPRYLLLAHQRAAIAFALDAIDWATEKIRQTLGLPS